MFHWHWIIKKKTDQQYKSLYLEASWTSWERFENAFGRAVSLSVSPLAFVCTSVQVVLSLQNRQPRTHTHSHAHTPLNLQYQHPRNELKKLGFECRVFPKWFVIDPAFTLRDTKETSVRILLCQRQPSHQAGNNKMCFFFYTNNTRRFASNWKWCLFWTFSLHLSDRRHLL